MNDMKADKLAQLLAQYFNDQLEVAEDQVARKICEAGEWPFKLEVDRIQVYEDAMEQLHEDIDAKLASLAKRASQMRRVAASKISQPS
jgi:hypothetical protein